MLKCVRFPIWVLAGLSVFALRAQAADEVTVTALEPSSPSVLLDGTSVQVSFDYTSPQVGPRFVAVPYTAGIPSPNDSSSMELIYPVTALSGSSTCTFTILSGIVNVDAIHLQMRSRTNPDSLLLETIVPVAYAFNAKGAVYDIGFDPASVGAMVALGDSVHVAFSYQTTEAQGVRIFFQPVSGNTPAPGASFGPSVTLPAGSGAGTSYFTLTTEPALVDHVRVQMWRSNMTVLLAEAYLPVSYAFGGPTRREPVTWGVLKTMRW